MSVTDLKNALRTMKPHEFDRLVRGVLRLPKAEYFRVPAADVVRAGLWEWLDHLGYMSDGQMAVVLEAAGGVARRVAEGLAPDASVVIVDGLLFCAVAEIRDGLPWLDLTTGEPAPDPIGMPVTTIVCDINAMYAKLCRRVEAARRPKDAADDQGDGHGTA